MSTPTTPPPIAPYKVTALVTVVVPAADPGLAVRRATRRLDAAGFTVLDDPTWGEDDERLPRATISDHWMTGEPYEEGTDEPV